MSFICFDNVKRKNLLYSVGEAVEAGDAYVGKALGVTRERIRQIEAKALRKLKHYSRSKKLQGYIE